MNKKNLFLAGIFSISVLTLTAVVPSHILGESTTPKAFAASSYSYDIGNPNVRDYWISPTGNNSNSGDQSNPFATIGRAWEMVPQNTTLQTGFRFHIMSGTYSIPDLWLQDRIGTANAPIIFQGEGNVTVNGNINSKNLSYVYFINLKYISPNDVMHFEGANHILLRGVTLNSTGAQETLKINQSQYIYIEDSNISGAWDNAVDFVAVQYGHVVRSKIHRASDWCMYTKGGSAYITVDSNEFFDCGTGGFTAGQGTGLQFMSSPWLHYEAYDIKVTNNIVHDTDGAGLGVNGGYNILMAYNTLYNTGRRDHLIEFVYGSRSCDGNDAAACTPNLQLGAWGSTSDGGVEIGNKHVYFYNNIVLNAPGYMTAQWPAQFAIYGPRQQTISRAQGENPARDDVDLQIKGNIIWNPVADLGVSGENGCAFSNPTCNPAQLVQDNAINTIQPQLVNPAAGNFALAVNSNVFSVPSYAIPSFGWSDVPNSNTPVGRLSNDVSTDFFGTTRSNTVAGALAGISTATPSPSPSISPSPSNSPTPNNSPTASAAPSPSPSPSASPSPSPSPTPSTSPSPNPSPSTSPSPSSAPTRLADIEGYWNNVDKICSTRRGVTNCQLTSSLHPFNAGNAKSTASTIGVYLSADANLDGSDILIKTVNMKAINAGTGIAINFSYSGPVDYVRYPYLIAKFDNGNTIRESDETDNLGVYYPL